MVLNSAGIDRLGHVQLSGVPVSEESTESQLGQVGVRSGWMVAAVGEDNGSQFTQGSGMPLIPLIQPLLGGHRMILYSRIISNKSVPLDSSQLFDSQASQPLIPGIRTLNPYQLPSAPTVRESSRQPSSNVSPSRPRGHRGPIRSTAGPSPLSGTSGRRAFGRQSTGSALSGMLENGEE